MAKNRIGSLSYSIVLDNNPLKQGLAKARKMMEDHGRREKLRQRVRDRGGTGAGGSFGRRALDSRMTRMRAGLNRSGVGAMLGRVGRLGPWAALLAGAAAAAKGMQKVGQIATETAATMAKARLARTTLGYQRQTARGSADPFGMTRQEVRERQGTPTSNQSLIRLGRLERIQQTTAAKWERTGQTWSGVFAPLKQWGSQQWGQFAEEMNVLGEAASSLVSNQQRPATNLRQVYRETEGRQRAIGLLRGGGGGAAPTAEAGSRELYNVFVQRQQAQRAIQDERLARLAETGQTNELLEQILNAIMDSDPFAPNGTSTTDNPLPGY